MRRAGIVVDAKRQIAGLCHSLEMREHLVLGQRCVGNRCQQQAVRPAVSRVQRQSPCLVGTHRADADDQGRAAAQPVDRDPQRAASLIPIQIHVAAGAAQKSDRIDPGRGQPLQDGTQCRGLDPARSIGGRDRKGRKAVKDAAPCLKTRRHVVPHILAPPRRVSPRRGGAARAGDRPRGPMAA